MIKLLRSPDILDLWDRVPGSERFVLSEYMKKGEYFIPYFIDEKGTVLGLNQNNHADQWSRTQKDLLWEIYQPDLPKVKLYQFLIKTDRSPDYCCTVKFYNNEEEVKRDYLNDRIETIVRLDYTEVEI